MIRTVSRCAHCQSLVVEGVRLDPVRREIIVGDAKATLRPSEVAILQRLIEASGTAVHDERLMIAVWGRKPDGGPDSAKNGIKVGICRLRGKLRLIRAPLSIRAVHGFGYALEPAHPKADTRVLRRSELTEARTAAALDEVPA